MGPWVQVCKCCGRFMGWWCWLEFVYMMSRAMVAPWGSGRCDHGRRTRVKMACSWYEVKGIWGRGYRYEVLGPVHGVVVLA